MHQVLPRLLPVLALLALGTNLGVHTAIAAGSCSETLLALKAANKLPVITIVGETSRFLKNSPFG
jgi:hypothetical protein